MARASRYSRRKQRGQKPRKLGRVFYLLEIVTYSVIATTAGAAFFGFLRTSERFQIQAVVIEGIDALSEPDVLAASGITEADNTLFLATGAVASRVESMPYVDTCEVSVRFPDTVVVRVRERLPAATVMVNSRVYEIDANAIVLRQYEPDEIPVEPYFTNVQGVDFVTVGGQLTQPALLEAQAAWAAFRNIPAAEGVTVSEIAAYDPDDIRMYCVELSYEIRWGRGSYAEQAKRLDVLWGELGHQLKCREYLDLRFGENLICK